MSYMILAVGVLAFMDAALKMLSHHYPPLQLAAMRGMASLPFSLALLAHHGAFAEVVKVRWGWQLLRGVVSIITLCAFNISFKQLNLSDAYCIFFIAPLLIAALSVPFLGERIEWQRWLAIVVGLIGVIWMLRPSGNSLVGIGALAALVATISYVIGSIILRVVARTDSSMASTFWFLATVSIGAGLLALPDWVTPLAGDWGWLLAIGISGIIGQHTISEAFRMAPPAIIAPFEYTALLWGVLLDYVLWGASPNTGMWGGALIVIGSGLFMLWREHRTHKNSIALTPMDVPCALPELPK